MLGRRLFGSLGHPLEAAEGERRPLGGRHHSNCADVAQHRGSPPEFDLFAICPTPERLARCRQGR